MIMQVLMWVCILSELTNKSGEDYTGTNYILYRFLWSYSKWGVNLPKQMKAIL